MIASIPSFHEGNLWRITPRLHYKTRLNRFISRTKPRASSFHSLFPEDDEIRQDHCLYIISNAGVLHIPSHKTKSEMRRSLSERVLHKIQLPNIEEQGICMAGTFSVAASNGIDIKRKVHFQVNQSHTFVDPQSVTRVSVKVLRSCRSVLEMWCVIEVGKLYINNVQKLKMLSQRN